MSRVGAHWPTKLLSSFLPSICSSSEPTIEPPAAHRNRSEGSLAVCCSIVRATTPSVCCRGDAWPTRAVASIRAPSFRTGIEPVPGPPPGTWGCPGAETPPTGGTECGRDPKDLGPRQSWEKKRRQRQGHPGPACEGPTQTDGRGHL